jgi:hypothetical protein
MKNHEKLIDPRELELVSKFLAPFYSQTPEEKAREIESCVLSSLLMPSHRDGQEHSSIETGGFVAWTTPQLATIQVSVAAHFFTGKSVLAVIDAVQILMQAAKISGLDPKLNH